MFIFLKFLKLLPFIFSLVWWTILLCENWVNVLIGVWINYTNVKKCLLVLYLTPGFSYFNTQFFACVCFALFALLEVFASNARLCCFYFNIIQIFVNKSRKYWDKYPRFFSTINTDFWAMNKFTVLNPCCPHIETS